MEKENDQNVTALFGVDIDDETIAGLAGVKKHEVTPELRKQIKGAINQGYKAAASSKSMTYAASAFITKATRELRSQDSAKLFDGSVVLTDGFIFAANDLSGISDNILNPIGLLKNPGVTNLVNQKMESDYPLLVTKIKMGYQRTTAGTLPAAGIYSCNGQALPAYFVGAHLEVIQNDKVAIRVPVADYFTDPGVALVPNGEVASRNGYVDLDNPVLLHPNAAIQIKIVPALSQTIPAAATNATLFKVNLKGMTVTPRLTSN
jgi:hypothetical protein